MDYFEKLKKLEENQIFTEEQLDELFGGMIPAIARNLVLKVLPGKKVAGMQTVERIAKDLTNMWREFSGKTRVEQNFYEISNWLKHSAGVKDETFDLYNELFIKSQLEANKNKEEQQNTQQELDIEKTSKKINDLETEYQQEHGKSPLPQTIQKAAQAASNYLKRGKFIQSLKDTFRKDGASFVSVALYNKSSPNGVPSKNSLDLFEVYNIMAEIARIRIFQLEYEKSVKNQSTTFQSVKKDTDDALADDFGIEHLTLKPTTKTS